MRQNILIILAIIALQLISLISCCQPGRPGISSQVSLPLTQVLELHTFITDPVTHTGLVADGSGSCVVVDRRGYLVTCWHVCRDTQQVCADINGESLVCTVVAHDETLDLALVRVEHTFRNPTTWGNSTTLKQGDSLFVVGYPFDVCEAVSIGVLSGRVEIHGCETLMTDAAINPGNSGGGVFDGNGALVGLPSRIYSAQGLQANVGIGFAIPGNTVHRFVILNLPPN